MTAREILIELGNIGIKGTLKPSDYYNGKVDQALADLRELVMGIINDKVKQYAGSQVGNCVPLLEAGETIADLFKGE